MKLALRLLWLSFCLAAAARAQNAPFALDSAAVNRGQHHDESRSSTQWGVSAPDIADPGSFPRLAPASALQAFERRSVLQERRLASYSATMLVLAQLPDIAQSGEYELKKRYSAPQTLVFKVLHFAGDNFVKYNVILRLLESEVEHLRKDDPALTAVTSANYKFSYSGNSQMNGRPTYVFQLKPRRKGTSLFKGRIYLDAYSGNLVREEGRLVKSPSFFVKKIEFVQDFADIDSFTLPVHIHSEAQARFVGHTIVDIYQGDYQLAATGFSAKGAGHFSFDCSQSNGFSGPDQ
jgi:hypothetical protein